MLPHGDHIDDSYVQQILAARRRTPGENFLATFAINEMAREFNLIGIRSDYPDASEEQVLEILRRRVELARRLDDVPLPTWEE